MIESFAPHYRAALEAQLPAAAAAGAAVADADPLEAYARFVQRPSPMTADERAVSQQLAEHLPVNIVRELEQLHGQALARVEERAFFAGYVAGRSTRD